MHCCPLGQRQQSRTLGYVLGSQQLAVPTRQNPFLKLQRRRRPPAPLHDPLPLSISDLPSAKPVNGIILYLAFKRKPFNRLYPRAVVLLLVIRWIFRHEMRRSLLDVFQKLKFTQQEKFVFHTSIIPNLKKRCCWACPWNSLKRIAANWISFLQSMSHCFSISTGVMRLDHQGKNWSESECGRINRSKTSVLKCCYMRNCQVDQNIAAIAMETVLFST